MVVKYQDRIIGVQSQKMLHEKICKKYKIGKVINISIRDGKDDKTLKKVKALITKFYPFHVSCIVRGHTESFTYWDMDKMVCYNKG